MNIDKTIFFQVKIIAKIEGRSGFDNIEEIVEAADGIIISRGNIGVDIDTDKVNLLIPLIW